MSVWMELQCDVRADKPPNVEIYQPFCYSQRGDSIMEQFNNGRTSAADAYGVLCKRAKSDGWKFSHNHGWACPNCKTTL